MNLSPSQVSAIKDTKIHPLLFLKNELVAGKMELKDVVILLLESLGEVV